MYAMNMRVLHLPTCFKSRSQKSKNEQDKNAELMNTFFLNQMDNIV